MIRRVLNAMRGRRGVREQASRRQPAQVGDAGSRGLAEDALTRFGLPALKVFTDRDGLPQNTVMALDFDRDGYLWIGTEDGAARYDGRIWHVVPMPNRTASNFVRAVVGSVDGSVWFALHGGGLVRYHKDSWTTYRRADGLPDDICISLLETVDDRGTPTLWVGTRGGLARFAGGAFRTFTTRNGLPNDIVLAMRETRDAAGRRSLWVGTRGGLGRLRDGEWSAFTTRDGLPADSIRSLCDTPDSGGGATLWIGTALGGLARFDGRDFTVYDTSHGLPSEKVYSIARVSGGAGDAGLWLGTLGGLAHFHEGRVRSIDVHSGLPHNAVLSLLAGPGVGDTQMLWIGTDGGGLARMVRNRWLGFDTRTGLPDPSVLSICEVPTDAASPQMLFGTDEGLARFDGAWSSVGVGQGLPSPIVLSLHATVGGTGTEVYAGTSPGGAVTIDDGHAQSLAIAGIAEGTSVSCFLTTTAADGSNVLWVGSDAGVARRERGVWRRYGIDDGLPHLYVTSLAATRASNGAEIIWIGTNGGGLARLEGERITSFNTSSGFPNNAVVCLREVCFADGARELWAGTLGAGIARLDLDDERRGWRTISDETQPALPNNTVYKILSDALGRVYVATNKGVARLTPDGSDSFTVYVFTTDDGLPSNECNANAGLVDSKGRLWVGTVAGAAMFDPYSEVEDRVTKPLHVNAVYGRGRRRTLANNQSLEHNQSDIVFTFDLLSYFRESDTRYRTQLCGFDEVPSDWSPEWKRTYTNLPAGTYSFRVWGRDYAGNVTGPESVGFEVRRAPWRTWWAYLGYAGAAMGAAYGGVQWRLHTLRHRTELLEATVSEQTAELAAKVDQLRHSEAITREKADELALAVDQLRTAERNAQRAKAEAIAAKDKALDASHAKSVFLSSMSHELRTPLNAVLGFAQLLERDPTLTVDQRDHLSAIMSSGEHLLHLINDVLSLSKIEAGKLSLSVEPFDLHRTIDGVEAMLRGRTRAKRLRLVVAKGDALPRQVLGDEGKLRQVLINLLGNAVKFTEQGTVTLAASWRDGIAEFTVSDTGVGVAEDELGTLFEPFVQSESGRRAKEGTGLGLAISRNFVEMMGGHIGVESTFGKGTTFRFDVELPSAEDADLSEGRRAILELEPGQREFKILVVDDAPRNRDLLIKLLSAVGFTVGEAEDGRDAIAVWTNWQPHAILMDMRMPVMDGRAATTEIRRLEREMLGALDVGNGARTVIISLTASAFEHEREEILMAGCDDFLTKPFREDALFEKLAKHLGARFLRTGTSTQQSPGSASTGIVPPESLRELPVEWLSKLSDAVVKGDVEQASRLVQLLESHDAALALQLASLIKSYRFDELQDLLEQAAG